MADRFRTGRTVGRTVYRVREDGSEELVGCLDTRVLAAMFVDAVNAADDRPTEAEFASFDAALGSCRVPPVGDAVQAIRDRLGDLGTEGRDQEGIPDGSLWLDGLDEVAADLARVVYPFLAAQARERAERAERERDSLVRRLGVRFGELEEARADLRQMRDERGREPTSERQAIAQAALIAAWPDLAADPVYVEQVAAVALNAAYNPAWRDGLYAGLRPEGGGSDA